MSLRSELLACTLQAMIHHRHPIRLAKALLSLLLVLVSVAAPVVAQTYVCPMAKASSESAPSCCVQAALDASRQAGDPLWSRTCDCPKITWDLVVTDPTRQSASTGQVAPSYAVALPSAELLYAVQTQVGAGVAVRESGPPKRLWLQHQVIRC